MKRKDYLDKCDSLQKKVNRKMGFECYGKTIKEKEAWALYEKKRKILKKELTNFTNKKSHELGRVKKTDIADFKYLENKINILLTAYDNFVNHIHVIVDREKKGDLSLDPENDEYLRPNVKLTGSNTIRHIRSHQLLSKSFSNFDDSIYEYFQVGTHLVEIRINDYFSERGKYSVSLLRLGKPLDKGKFVRDGSHMHLGSVEKSNKYVTTIKYDDCTKIYNTFYANTITTDKVDF